MKYEVTLNVNGQAYPVELDAHLSLLDAVRGPVGLTGSKEGCDDSECGACMMLLDGQPVNACSYLALQAARSPPSKGSRATPRCIRSRRRSWSAAASSAASARRAC